MKKTFNFEDSKNQNEIEIVKGEKVHRFVIKDMYLKDQLQFASIKKMEEDEQLEFIIGFLDDKLNGDSKFSELDIKADEAMKILDYVIMIVSGKSEEEYEHAKKLASQLQTARPVQSTSMLERAKATQNEQSK